MLVKVKLGSVVNFSNSLTAAQQTIERADKRFCYALDVNVKRVTPIAQAYDKQQQALVDEYCEHDEKGDRVLRDVTVMTPNGPQAGKDVVWKDFVGFTKESNALGDEDVDLDVHVVAFELFPDQMSPRVFAGLSPMVKADPEPAASATTDAPVTPPAPVTPSVPVVEPAPVPPVC